MDEGAEAIRLRNAVAERLTGGYGISLLMDGDRERLGVLCRRIDRVNSMAGVELCIDIHFNAVRDTAAHGTEVIVADDATEFEIKTAVRLLNSTARALGTDRRGVRTESQVPRRRLGILHLSCPSVVLEVCFCTNVADSVAYRRNFDRLVRSISRTIKDIMSER